jgi:hypothetical protein
LYTLVVVVIAVIALLANGQFSWRFLGLFRLILALLGIGYVFASLLAWTGFGNLYRYSPTLFLGSRSYRQMVTRGSIGKEGRDTESLWTGVLFGLSLFGTAFALTDAISAAIAIIIATIVVSAYIRWIPAGSPPPPSNP